MRVCDFLVNSKTAEAVPVRCGQPTFWQQVDGKDYCGTHVVEAAIAHGVHEGREIERAERALEQAPLVKVGAQVVRSWDRLDAMVRQLGLPHALESERGAWATVKALVDDVKQARKQPPGMRFGAGEYQSSDAEVRRMYKGVTADWWAAVGHVLHPAQIETRAACGVLDPDVGRYRCVWRKGHEEPHFNERVGHWSTPIDSAQPVSRSGAGPTELTCTCAHTQAQHASYRDQCDACACERFKPWFSRPAGKNAPSPRAPGVSTAGGSEETTASEG